jgi:hypothetical protein
MAALSMNENARLLSGVNQSVGFQIAGLRESLGAPFPVASVPVLLRAPPWNKTQKKNTTKTKKTPRSTAASSSAAI